MEVKKMNPSLLTSAFVLDLLMGDPLWLPHPVRLIGSGIAGLEKILRRVAVSRVGEKGAGLILTITIVSTAFGCTWLTIAVGRFIHPYLEAFLIVYFSYACLATKSLGDAANGVSEALENTALPLARQRLSHIVSRETNDLSEEAMIRATVETVAENTSDGVVAPLFYLALGGPALAMAYKAVNTLDSMVGYRTPQYRHFGWASARMDDWANYFPARITGFLVALSAALFFQGGRQALKIMQRDGRKHDSPNAGIPEAATAGALDIQLGGPSTYKGVLKEKPWLGDAGQKLENRHIQNSIHLMQSTGVLMGLCAVIALVILEVAQ